jgi:hypothetical protein
MRAPSQDPTAGETARAIRSLPWARLPIHDPTNPRCETLSDDAVKLNRGTDRILDPTDPRYGHRYP